MSNKAFTATVMLPSGGMQDVTVQASTWGNAQELLEAQYGKGCVLGVRELQDERSSIPEVSTSPSSSGFFSPRMSTASSREGSFWSALVRGFVRGIKGE